MKAVVVRTTMAAVVAVAVLMAFAPGLNGLHASPAPSTMTPLVTYNPAPAAKFHAPVSTVGIDGLARTSIPSITGAGSIPALASGGGMTSVPSNAIRFIHDGSYMPQSETTIAVNPANNSLVVGGVNDGRWFFCPALPAANCPSGWTVSLSGFSVSNNGGATVLKSNDLPGLDVTTFNPANQTNASDFLVSWGDPSLAAGVGSAFYYASLAISPTTGANGIELSESNANLWSTHNACVTPQATPDTNPCWSSTLVFGNLTVGAGSFEDKELIAVDHDLSSAFYGDVYITWDHFSPSGTSSTYGARCTSALVCTMISGGGAAITISGSDPFVAFSTPTVDASGNLFVTWCNYGTATTIGPIKCSERGSSPGGTSWGGRSLIVSFAGRNSMLPWAGALVGFATEQFRTDSVPDIAADTSGISSNLYFTIAVCVSGSYFAFAAPGEPGLCGQTQIVTAESTNGGKSWSTPMNVSTPAVNAQPWVTVDPSNGHVVIAWLSSQYDAFNHRMDVVTAVSANQGSSYTNSRLTTVSNEPDADPNYFNYLQQFGGSFSVPQYGDYIQAVAMHGQVWVLFTGDYTAELGTLQADPYLVMGTD